MWKIDFFLKCSRNEYLQMKSHNWKSPKAALEYSEYSNLLSTFKHECQLELQQLMKWFVNYCFNNWIIIVVIFMQTKLVPAS